MRTQIILFIIFITISSNSIHAGDEFVISTEPSPSQFIRENPQLFFNNDDGFIVFWNDYRDGEPTGYYQLFDNDGMPVGQNTAIWGNTYMDIMPDGTMFSIKEWHELEFYPMSVDFDLPYLHVDGRLHFPSGTTSDLIDMGKHYIPFCGTGYLGHSVQIYHSNQYFYINVFDDGNYLRHCIDADGNDISTYQRNRGDAETLQVLPYGVAQPDNHSVTSWLQFNDSSYNINSINATFYNSQDSVIAGNVVIDTLTLYSFGCYKNISHVVCLDSLHYLFLWYNESRNSLRYARYTLDGQLIGGITEYQLYPDPASDVIEHPVYIQNFQISQWHDDQLDILFQPDITWDPNDIYPAPLTNTNKAYHFVLEKQNGNLQFVNDYLWEIHSTSNQFWSLSDQKRMNPNYSGNQIFLETYQADRLLEQTVVNDDTEGSNQQNPKVFQLDDTRMFVYWQDEKQTIAQLTDSRGNLIGESFSIADGTYTRLSDEQILGFNINRLIYYETTDWSVIQQDTISWYPIAARAYANGFVVTTRWGHKLKLRHYNLSRELLDEYNFGGSYERKSVRMLPVSPDLFWLVTCGSMQLFSYNLIPQSPIITFNEMIEPLHATSQKRFFCRDFSEGNLCLIDSTGAKVAEHSLPPSEIYLSNIHSLPLPNEYSLLMWTENQNAYAQIFTDRLRPVAESFTIHTQVDAFQKAAHACLIGDSLFAVWADARFPGHGYDILGRTFDLSKIVTNITDTQSGKTNTIRNYSLMQNYPNPFNPSTTISYLLPEASNVIIKLYNMLGQPITTLVHEHQNAGAHHIIWDGQDSQGHAVSSGVYVYKMTAGDFHSTKKMVLMY